MIRFFVGWMLSAWCVAELLMLFPALEPVLTDVKTAFTIPTHDKWDLTRVSEERAWIETQLLEQPGVKIFGQRFLLQLSSHRKASHSSQRTSQEPPFLYEIDSSIERAAIADTTSEQVMSGNHYLEGGWVPLMISDFL